MESEWATLTSSALCPSFSPKNTNPAANNNSTGLYKPNYDNS